MNFAQFLQDRQIPFDLIPERSQAASMTADEACATRGRHIAKTVLLRTPDGYLIAIYPWGYRLNLENLQMLVGVHPIVRASVAEVQEQFADTPEGFVPPLGSRYGIRSVMDIHLAGCASILFRAPIGADSIRMALEDFDRIEHPIRGFIADPP